MLGKYFVIFTQNATNDLYFGVNIVIHLGNTLNMYFVWRLICSPKILLIMHLVEATHYKY